MSELEGEIDDVCTQIIQSRVDHFDVEFCILCEVLLSGDDVDRLNRLLTNKYFVNASFCIDKDLILEHCRNAIGITQTAKMRGEQK